MALGGVPDLPSTRNGCLQLLLTLAMLFTLVFAFLYFWPGSLNTGHAGRLREKMWPQ